MTFKQAINECSRLGHVPMELRGQTEKYDTREEVIPGSEKEPNILVTVADIRNCTRCGLLYDAMVELDIGD